VDLLAEGMYFKNPAASVSLCTHSCVVIPSLAKAVTLARGDISDVMRISPNGEP
jgi:hypothetical protein